jgi:ribosome biogenesis GTPase A
MAIIQWYPGHIAKAERTLQSQLKLVDVVIEVLDARLPLASINPRIREAYGQKPAVCLLNKSDLADSDITQQWLKYLAEAYPELPILRYDARHGQFKVQLIQILKKLSDVKMQALMAKGLKRRPVRTLVVGMPNVGKSMIINSLVGRKKAQTGHKAGVTRQPQWVRIHPDVQLLDVPGIIPPQLSSDEVGALLACVSGVGEAAYDETVVSQFLIHRMGQLDPGRLSTFYGLEEVPVTLESIAQKRQMVTKGGEIDYCRVAQAVLKDLRQAAWGSVSLEQPNVQPSVCFNLLAEEKTQSLDDLT